MHLAQPAPTENSDQNMDKPDLSGATIESMFRQMHSPGIWNEAGAQKFSKHPFTPEQRKQFGLETLPLMQVLFGMPSSNDPETDSRIAVLVNDQYMNYLAEVYNDNLGQWNSETKTFANKGVLINYHTQVLAMLKKIDEGKGTITQSDLNVFIDKILESKQPITLKGDNTLAHSILNIIDEEATEDNLQIVQRKMLATNLYATFIGYKAIWDAYNAQADLLAEGPEKDCLKEIFDIATNGYKQRQSPSIYILENPTENIEALYEHDVNTILTNVTFGTYLLGMVMADPTLLTSISRNLKVNLTSIVQIASALIRNYNNLGPILDQLNVDLFKDINSIDELKAYVTGLTDPKQKQLFQRLIKDFNEAEWNSALCATGTDQLVGFSENLRQNISFVKGKTQKALINLLSTRNPDVFNLLAKFVVFNHILYSTGGDYDGEVDSAKSDKWPFSPEVLIKILNSVKPLQIQNFIFGAYLRRLVKE